MELSTEMQKILSLARRERASDIHIVVNLPPMFRINGEIVLADRPPLSRDQTAQLCLGLLNTEQRKTFERDWQLCYSLFDAQLGRFRVALYLHAGNPEMAIRPVMDHVQTREDLRLPKQVEDLTRLSGGLVLITGPTGSGKTTTMNYMIDLLNSERRCKIVAIEDPVEFIHQRKKAIIVQQELHTDVRSFSKALIHVLRQDPDVICIGEMRDWRTVATALTAAEPGHLVISTLHTQDTVHTLERIVDVFPPHQQGQIRYQLASVLQAVLCQKLLLRVSGRGRVLAYEVMIGTLAMRRLIRENKTDQIPTLLQTGRESGMISMDQCIKNLYHARSISHEVARAAFSDPEHFKEPQWELA